ncbi:hypothetical protein CP968_18105 [Streptomyces subrutilus]|uniref:Transposase n=1 Tax=Streptomyces subrutilus TaxID=36818 RepID=A0A5P2UKZ3_9ACTN|nr:hypothetical protein CP968_18105 [Streptomyces subrutilus]
MATQAGDAPSPPLASPRQRRPRLDHQALQAVAAEACVHGVSTRSVDDLLKAFGSEARTAKSGVPRICFGIRRTARGVPQSATGSPPVSPRLPRCPSSRTPPP